MSAVGEETVGYNQIPLDSDEWFFYRSDLGLEFITPDEFTGPLTMKQHDEMQKQIDDHQRDKGKT